MKAVVQLLHNMCSLLSFTPDGSKGCIYNEQWTDGLIVLLGMQYYA